MRCKLCRKPAVYGPLRFCKEHFLAYYEKRVRRYFESTGTRNVKVLVGVSGGKDSAALAHVLAKVKDDFGLELGLFTIDLNIPDYSEKGLVEVRRLAERLVAAHDIPLIVEDLREHPRIIPEFAESSRKPCGPCGTIKRYLLNKVAIERGYDYVATGHNLDDEHYFVMHNLMHRNVNQLRRQQKKLPPRPKLKLAGRIKPLYYLTEKENRLYCLLEDIPHDADECPFSKDNPQLRFKERFASLSREEKKNVLKSVAKLQEPSDGTAVADEAGAIHPCPACGYPTTSSKECVYCTLMGKKGQKG